MGVEKKFTGLALMAALMLVSNAFAASTVVEGPGFKVENKKGWFGTSRSTYTDALGNKIENRTGLFGGKHKDAVILGNPVMNNNNINVLGPNGDPIVTQKKTIFGGQNTHVDLNPLIQGIMNRLNGTPLPTLPNP